MQFAHFNISNMYIWIESQIAHTHTELMYRRDKWSFIYQIQFAWWHFYNFILAVCRCQFVRLFVSRSSFYFSFLFSFIFINELRELQARFVCRLRIISSLFFSSFSLSLFILVFSTSHRSPPEWLPLNDVTEIASIHPFAILNWQHQNDNNKKCPNASIEASQETNDKNKISMKDARVRYGLHWCVPY